MQTGKGPRTGAVSRVDDRLKGIKATTGLVVIGKLVELSLAAIVLWIAGWITGVPYFSHLFAALVPTSPAVYLGLELAVPFFIVFELIWWGQKKVGLSTVSSENYIVAPKVSGQVVRSFAASFSEELVFRGALQALTGLWIANAIFGLWHYSGKKSWPYMCTTFVMGIVLGLVYIHTGSLWAPIIIHMSNNLLAFLFADRLRKLLPR